MTDNDRRLIEDYIPIRNIETAALSENARKGHISTLHLWRARRPLMACRAAVYAALVPAPSSKHGRGPKSDFVTRLCRYPGDPKVIAQAQKHVLEAHAERLSRELGKPVTVKDIQEGREPGPKVLDVFAGGGAIPLEALRMGCDAHALELNPVAHIIELCTLVYPQKYGKTDPNATGSAPDSTWAGLAEEVEYWGKQVLERARSEVGGLYPPVPDPDNPPQTLAPKSQEEFATTGFERPQEELRIPGGYLTPTAYLWTRTVPCKNPNCGASVPLFRQTWLRKKPSGFVALRPYVAVGRKTVLYEVVKAASASALGFDPAEGSSGTSTDCRCCGAAIDAPYVREFGSTQGYGQELMAVVCTRPGGQGKVYLSDPTLFAEQQSINAQAEALAEKLERKLGNTSLDELIPPSGNAGLATGISYLHGIRTFRQAYTPRQLVVLFTFALQVRDAVERMRARKVDEGRIRAIAAYLGLLISRLTDRFCNLARWDNSRETVQGCTSMKRYAMTWDFPEINVFGGASGDASGALDLITAVIKSCKSIPIAATVERGTATRLPWDDGVFDAVVTDPPYYDNESYSELSDICYVWLKMSLATTFPEHFSTPLTPKRQEIVAAAYRFGGTKQAAEEHYEHQMEVALKEANRVLKPGAPLVMVYAHRTTVGWSTVVEAVRSAGFAITEAWPIETEAATRVAHREDAALASSIFLAARRRESHEVGDYDTQVRPELEAIIRERVETFWEQGVSGADLVIAAVGAGLRAFTRFARVEYSNGEEVPAERFLAEVEGVVLETLLEKIFGLVGARVSSVDGPSQLYVLWRYTYHAAPIDAGEAIVFTYGLPVELDGPHGLSTGSRALVDKKKNKYQLRDFADRGDDDKLGIPADDGTPAPLIDVLHRVLYLMENRPGALSEFIAEARPDLERLRLVANALAGPQLKGGENGDRAVITTPAEQSAINKLVANWRSLLEGHMSQEERTGVKRRLPGF